jgi:hypothetical protein
VVWLGCGVASALIAQRQGGNPLNWFLCGVILGPFGVLLTLISAKPPVPVIWTGPPPEKPSAFRLPVTVEQAPGTTADPANRLDQLAGLRERGAITEEEYQAKKAELLARM